MNTTSEGGPVNTRDYGLCVDNNDDPKAVAEAIAGLRRTAKLGRIAERALRDLKLRGKHSGRAPVATPTWFRDASAYGNIVIPRVFTPRHSATREEFHGWGEFQPEFGGHILGEHAGTPTKEIRLHVRSNFVHANDWCWQEGTLLLGSVRIKNDGSMVLVQNRPYNAPDLKSNRTVTKIYRRPSTGNAKKAYRELAELLSFHFIRFTAEDRNAGKIPHKWIALLNAIPGWLLEDGHVQRLCESILDNALAADVMSS